MASPAVATASGETGASSSVVTVTISSSASTATSTTGGTVGISHPLQPMNGWVSGADNDVGIEGAFWTVTDNADGGTAIISPASFETSGNQICVSGTAEQVLNMEYSVYWGALVGLNLNQREGEDAAGPYDALAAGVTGFGFDISALPIGGQLRFAARVSGDDGTYCRVITSTVANEFRWEDLRLSCWAAEASTPDPTRIEAIQWQIVTNDSSAYDFSFCITNLTALTN